jgi:hypothetical protein
VLIVELYYLIISFEYQFKTCVYYVVLIEIVILRCFLHVKMVDLIPVQNSMGLGFYRRLLLSDGYLIYPTRCHPNLSSLENHLEV